MSRFQYLKSNEQMVYELFTLWDNKNLYEFLNGEEYVRQQEREITKQLTKKDREMFILLAEFDYIFSHTL
jgi:hypothetical protein